jgi:hypothetical protein
MDKSTDASITLSIDVERLAAALAAHLAHHLRPIMMERGRDVVEPSPLQPLATILDVSPAAARMRLMRDPELRAIGLRAGRRLLFRRGDVEALLAVRTRDERR